MNIKTEVKLKNSKNGERFEKIENYIYNDLTKV